MRMVGLLERNVMVCFRPIFCTKGGLLTLAKQHTGKEMKGESDTYWIHEPLFWRLEFFLFWVLLTHHFVSSQLPENWRALVVGVAWPAGRGDYRGWDGTWEDHTDDSLPGRIAQQSGQRPRSQHTVRCCEKTLACGLKDEYLQGTFYVIVLICSLWPVHVVRYLAIMYFR